VKKIDGSQTPSRNVSVKCFGVGDGWPCADRNHSSFLYRFGEVTLLIDCGEPISRLFKATGLDYDGIDQIFISHLHFDHVGGFFMLIQGFWLEQRRKDLPVHLPRHGIGPIRQMLNAACVFDELRQFRLLFESIEVGKPVIANNVRVTPFSTTHLEGLRRRFEKQYPQSFEAFSFVLEWDGLRIGHSADIGAAEDLAPLLEKPLDLLVCELAHVQPEDLFRYLRRFEIKRIVFVHVGRPYWENLEATRLQAAQMLRDIPFSFARDGEEIVL
jgi:ribonuclease BN (tRNA processing enzyme)